MSTEHIGGNDSLPSQPSSSGSGEPRPLAEGYPPPDVKARLEAAEAAAASETGDIEGDTTISNG